jgi:hypothetical protein
MWQQGNTAAMQTQITPALRAAQWSAQDTGAQPLCGDVCPTTDKGADMNKRNEAFDRVMARLKAQVGPEVFTSWFGRLKLQSASKSVVRLSVPTAFLKSWIYNKYLDQISALFREENPDILKVEIVVLRDPVQPPTGDRPEPPLHQIQRSRAASRTQHRARSRMSRSKAGAPSFPRNSKRGHRQPMPSSARRWIRNALSTAMLKDRPIGWRLPPPEPLRKPALVR